MSKHLLYCKDLLNRTVTRSLLFVVPQLVACLIVLFQTISPAEAAGPLSVKSTNPRYFFDSKGNPVYLTGSYLNEYNLLSGSWDFAPYLDFLQQQNQNFTRVWGWEQSPWIYDNTGQISFSTQPYQRSGPGLALDGGLKFDLTRFNQAYFDQLRSRVVQAAQRGIYVSVMLFEGFSTHKKVGRINPWLGDPFQQVNNINGINGDPNQNGGGEEFFSLAFPSLLALQEAFARKVVDTLNDLDNVLYEVNGNGLAGSLSWQYHMIDYIKRYQKKQAVQHPVGISDFYAGATGDVFNSSAEWIVVPETNLNPPPATTKKVLIMEGTPPVSGGQVLSTSPISLFQLLPDSVVSSQSSAISNNVPSSNGVTLLSSSATSSTSSATKSSSKNQQGQVATPTITPNGGLYSGSVAVTLQTTTPGASIYYTTDGQSPTQSSRQYTGKFTVSGSTLIKAKAFKSNLEPSSEASAWFANAAGPAASASGLVAYWKLDEGSGTTALDASGNGNTGTLVNGPQWTAGRVGNALFFDGIDDNVTILDSNSLDLSSSFTLSAWVNPAATFTDFRSILVKNYKYYLYASVAGYCGDGSPLAGFSSATTQTVCQPAPLPINTWIHLVVTYNGSTLTLYQNGVAVATSTVSGTLSSTTGTLQIGGSQFGEYFKGLIDEVRIYNRALSATEIQTIYQQDSVATSQIAATPVISPNGGSYSGSVPVTMQTATSGASIYYTTDGTSPTQSSTLYTGNMTLTNSATVKAKAFKNGYQASAESSASFTVTAAWTFCAVEDSQCNFSGTKEVRYGTNGVYVSQIFTGGVACSNTIFGDPVYGYPKQCEYRDVTGPLTVATPTISPNGGSYTSSVSVTMQTPTSGASIYYTTNGSSPTQSSTLYTGPIILTSSATLRAKAFKSGYSASVDASASFTVTQPFSFSLANSGNISVVAGSSVTNSISTTLVSGNAQAVTFSASGLPTGATASFSSISCSPTCSSTLTINTTGSTPAGSSTITVTASGGGITKTTTFSLAVSLPTVATPAISPNGGNFTNSVSVTMQTATSGASIYYTTNGSSPTQSSTLYTGAITLTTSATVRAKAFKNGYIASAESSASFTVTAAAWTFCAVEDSQCNFSGTKEVRYGISGVYVSQIFTGGVSCSDTIFGDPFYGYPKQCEYRDVTSPLTVATPTISPNGGSYTSSASVTMLTTTSGASIYYTTDGSSPTPLSTLYTGAMTLMSSATVRAKAFKNGYIASAESSASFTVTAAAWTFCAVEDSQCNFSGTKEVRYGINGVYVSQIFTGGVSCSDTIFGDPFYGYPKQCEYRDVTSPLTVATPTISPNGGSYTSSASVTMLTTTSGASIYYTTDGSSPTPLSTLYTGAMTLMSSATVRAKAFKNGYIASAESSASFTVTAAAWTFCAVEDSQCNFSGTKEVRYGINGVYVSQIFTGGVSCSNTIFGDPVYGYPKQCEYRDVSNPPFIFSLAKSGDISVVAGSSASNAITATLVSGSSQAVSFSVSGLPSGTTGNFSNTSCNPACSTVLNITTNGSTPAGTFSIMISATGGSMTVSTAFTLSITLALTATNPTITPAGTGNVYYVAKTGRDSYSCAQAQSQSTPKLTINGGLSCLSGGDTLLIRAGTYVEAIDSWGVGSNLPSGSSWANPTTIAAYPLNCSRGTLYGPGPSCDQVIVRPATPDTINPIGIKGNISYLIFDGIIVDGSLTADNVNLVRYDGADINGLGGPNHTRLINLEIRNGGCVGISGGGRFHEWLHNKIHDNGRYIDPKWSPQGCHGIYQGHPEALIDSNEIYNNTGWGVHIYANGVSSANKNVVRNNYVHDNEHVGILLGSGTGNIASNNIITRNGTGFQLDFGSFNPLVYNNTVYENREPCVVVGSGASGAIITNNICWQNLGDITDNGTNNFQSNNLIGIDPKFVNPAVNDFRLQSGSPAINAGTSSIATGITIPFNGSAPDIGALEY